MSTGTLLTTTLNKTIELLSLNFYNLSTACIENIMEDSHKLDSIVTVHKTFLVSPDSCVRINKEVDEELTSLPHKSLKLMMLGCEDSNVYGPNTNIAVSE